jgi:ribose/xylose/arabinose/galactoside ABC-type transport system permease subunit
MTRTPALRLLQRYQGVIGLALLLGVAFIFARKEFFSAANSVNILKQLAVPGTLAVGMTFVILTGGIDLSVGSLLALGNVILAEWARNNTGLVPSFLYVVTLCGAIGAFVGWLIGATKLQPFIVTLAAMVTVRGICYLYSNNAVVSVTDGRFDFLKESQAGLPVSAWILLAVTLASAVILRFTVFGRHIYALGGNEVAARFSGVPTKWVRMGAFAVNGLCIGIAAILYTARTDSGHPGTGMGYELDAIAAVVVGGSALVGGIGNILGTFVGALFIGCMNTLIVLVRMDPYVGMGWKGLIILAAVYLQNIGRDR